MNKPMVRDMLHWQRGQLEYAVAALAIWMTTEVGQYVCKTLPIWKIPLERWDQEVKDFSTECRRLGQIFGKGAAEVELAFQMRRLVCLAGRTDQDADWQKEVRERTSPGVAKRGYMHEVVSTLAYVNIRDQTLRQIVRAAMPALVRRAGSWTEYIDMRWWHTPRGTTSKAGATKNMLKAYGNPMLDLQLRPIKPVVYETLSRKGLLAEVQDMPKAHARGSTKPEPGLKRRALLAVDDTTAFVAGYASANVETTTKIEGMVLRQDPADVSEWVNFDLGNDVWRVSNDYTNFNILNSLRSMQLIDLMFAKAWSEVPYRFAEDKKYACLWVAASHNNATFQCPLGVYKAENGLWSGHRNTARDNTMLHVVYLNCVKSVQRALFGQAAQTSKQRICGDDETIAYNHWAPAVTHTLVADALGFKSQVTKGMLSIRHDEFLQLVRIPGRVPKYPVANTILTMCSGNWYKDPVRELRSTVKDISDHLWDMHLGGVPLDVCQGLGVEVLNYLVQVQDAGGQLQALEWWAFRGCGLPGGHPLWGNAVTEASPDVSGELRIDGLPSFASSDSFIKEEPIWRIIGMRARQRIQGQRTALAYRNVAKNALTTQYDAAVLDKWPRRVSNKPNTACQPTLGVVPANRWRAIPTRQVDRSARTVAIKVGFPPELINTKEMWRALPALAPRDRSAFLQGLTERQKPTAGWRWYMPPLLRVA
jgi:hypothetical protein